MAVVNRKKFFSMAVVVDVLVHWTHTNPALSGAYKSSNTCQQTFTIGDLFSTSFWFLSPSQTFLESATTQNFFLYDTFLSIARYAWTFIALYGQDRSSKFMVVYDAATFCLLQTRRAHIKISVHSQKMLLFCVSCATRCRKRHFCSRRWRHISLLP